MEYIKGEKQLKLPDPRSSIGVQVIEEELP